MYHYKLIEISFSHQSVLKYIRNYDIDYVYFNERKEGNEVEVRQQFCYCGSQLTESNLSTPE
jgi:hypothetical protein